MVWKTLSQHQAESQSSQPLGVTLGHKNWGANPVSVEGGAPTSHYLVSVAVGCRLLTGLAVCSYHPSFALFFSFYSIAEVFVTQNWLDGWVLSGVRRSGGGCCLPHVGISRWEDAHASQQSKDELEGSAGVVLSCILFALSTPSMTLCFLRCHFAVCKIQLEKQTISESLPNSLTPSLFLPVSHGNWLEGAALQRNSPSLSLGI